MNTETKVTGKKYRVCTDATNKNYDRYSYWTDASDVEFADGTDAKTNLGNIKGITDSLASTSSNIALSAKAGKDLNKSFDKIDAVVQMTDTHVSQSYNYAYQKSGIGVLNLDVYMQNTASYTEYTLGSTTLRPSNQIALRIVSSAQKIMQVVLKTDGAIVLNTSENSGAFNFEVQIIV